MWRKKNKAGGMVHSDFKLHHIIATGIKTVLHWHKQRNLGQQNKKEGPEINPHLYGQLNYNEGGKNYNREKTDSSINGVGESAELHAKERNCVTFS